MELANDGAGLVRYAAIEKNTLAVADLAPPETWPALEPGERTTIPYEDLLGYTAESTEAVVYWTLDTEWQDPVTVRLR